MTGNVFFYSKMFLKAVSTEVVQNLRDKIDVDRHPGGEEQAELLVGLDDVAEEVGAVDEGLAREEDPDLVLVVLDEGDVDAEPSVSYTSQSQTQQVNNTRHSILRRVGQSKYKYVCKLGQVELKTALHDSKSSKVFSQ